jgi:hypothetical protein
MTARRPQVRLPRQSPRIENSYLPIRPTNALVGLAGAPLTNLRVPSSSIALADARGGLGLNAAGGLLR